MTAPGLDNAQLLHRLVAFDTTSRNSNLDLVDFVSNYVDRPGVTVERNASPAGDKSNLVITVGRERATGRRDGVILSGHMDVVPAEEPEWNTNPFELQAEDDRYVARGACDMKGFLALAINEAQRVDPAAVVRPLVLILTYDEEVGTLGAKHFVETWPEADTLPRSAVIGEPTSLQVLRAHKGHVKFDLEILGRSAHSGLPHLGDNAIERAGRALTAFSTLRKELESEGGAHADTFPEVPYPALNVALISGGSAINIIPDRCRLQIGMRTLPGVTGDQLEPRLRTALSAALPEGRYQLERTGESPPMICAHHAHVNQSLTRDLGQPPGDGASFATDAGWFQSLGTECVLYGPGDIGVAHKANEFLPVSEFVQCADVIARLVQRFCIVEAP